MAITAADLIQPNGDIAPGWFPSLTADQLTTLVNAYIADGYARAAGVSPAGSQDLAAGAWAMHRATRAVALRLSAAPASASLAGEGSQTVTGEQIRTFFTMADKYAAEFGVYTAVDTTPSDDASGSACTGIVW